MKRKQPKKARGGIYARGGTMNLWITYYDETNTRVYVSAETHDKALAEKRWLELDKRARMSARRNGDPEGPLTVERYAKRWTEARQARGLSTAVKDLERLAHVPQLMRMRLEEVKRQDVKKAIQELMFGPEATRPAPRTIGHVYGILRVMFNDALADELVAVTPCTLRVRMHELPKKQDKDPLWRKTAKFTRQEVEQLISDARIPENRRMLYGLMLLAGPRINEITVRRWRDYDPEAQPLGSLSIHSAYSLRFHKEGPVKTKEPRETPVHPTLAAMLASWRLGGWARYQGRQPTADDLIMPGVKGSFLNSNLTWEWFQTDLKELGFRPRRQHDTRRTFITLALADGARKDLLRWVTHGPEGDQMDDYTSPPWDVLCEQVSKMRISLRSGQLVVLPTVTGVLQ